MYAIKFKGFFNDIKTRDPHMCLLPHLQKVQNYIHHWLQKGILLNSNNRAFSC